MTLAQTLALWAEKLRDHAAMGGHFATNIYDREHYQAVEDIAVEMMALATGENVETLQPLRTTHFRRPTPLTTGDAAIIDGEERILLIRRADDGRWAMPGGALAVGETPAEGVAREAFEETGVACRPVRLVGVHDSRLCGSPSPYHLYHFTFLCQPLNGGDPLQAPSHANEILDVRWFHRDELPDDFHGGHASRIAEAFRVRDGDPTAYFD